MNAGTNITRLSLCLLVLTSCFTGFSQIVINEVCSDNRSTITDQYLSTPDWIELVNMGSVNEDLSGYSLGDSPLAQNAFALPATTLAAGERIIIFCSGRNELSSEIHTDFKLAKEGETVWLFKDGAILHFVDVPALRGDHSYGRIEDVWFYYDVPTPLGSNNDSQTYIGYASTPLVYPASGLYSSNLSVEIIAPDADSLFWAIGGHSALENGLPYTDAIPIDSTAAWECVATQQGFLPSDPVFRTFLINEVDYGVPIIALSIDSLELFDEQTGLYSLGPNADPEWPHFGANFWSSRKLDCHISMIDDGELVLNRDGIVGMHGGKAARNHPLRPFRLISDGDSPSEQFTHKVFHNKPNASFKKLVLRNSGGDFNQYHFRDAWLHSFMIDRGLDIDLNGAEPSFIYLNGQPWGVLNIREKIDEYYVWQNHDLPQGTLLDMFEEDTLLIAGSIAPFDETLAFALENDLSQDAHFSTVANEIDIPSIIDYVIAETYLNNLDWPANNLKLWREQQSESAKWRYIMYDLDVTLNAVGFISPETDNLGRILNEFPENKHTQLFTALLTNNSFKEKFVTRYADLINDAFQTDTMLTHFYAFTERVLPAMEKHFELWGGSVGWWQFYHINQLVIPSIEERPQWARDYVESNINCGSQYQLYLGSSIPNVCTFTCNTLTIPRDQWDGRYFSEVPVVVEVFEKPFYSFSHWQSNVPELNGSTAKFLAFTSDTDVELKAIFSPQLEESELVVFPNPNKGRFDLTWNSQEPNHSIRIYDMAGKKVYSENLTNGTGEVKYKSLVLDLLQGIYLLEVRDGKKVRRGKFCVN